MDARPPALGFRDAGGACVDAEALTVRGGPGVWVGQSVQLLLSYGLFCDTILNDVKQSEALKHNAACLEGEVEEVEEEEQDKGTALGGGGKEWGEKSSSSENEPYRNKIQRFLRSHRDAMMGAEAKQVRTLHRRVQVALLMLMVLATA
eukprot:2110800-Rhodomonas_salina.1